MSFNPPKTKHMMSNTLQKRQRINSPPQHWKSANNIYEVSEHKVLGVATDNIITWGPHISDLCKSTAKKVTNRQNVTMSSPLMHTTNICSSPHSICYRLYISSSGTLQLILYTKASKIPTQTSNRYNTAATSTPAMTGKTL